MLQQLSAQGAVSYIKLCFSNLMHIGYASLHMRLMCNSSRWHLTIKAFGAAAFGTINFQLTVSVRPACKLLYLHWVVVHNACIINSSAN